MIPAELMARIPTRAGGHRRGARRPDDVVVEHARRHHRPGHPRRPHAALVRLGRRPRLLLLPWPEDREPPARSDVHGARRSQRTVSRPPRRMFQGTATVLEDEAAEAADPHLEEARWQMGKYAVGHGEPAPASGERVRNDATARGPGVAVVVVAPERTVTWDNHKLAQSLIARGGDSVRAVDYEQIMREQRDDIVAAHSEPPRQAERVDAADERRAHRRDRGGRRRRRRSARSWSPAPAAGSARALTSARCSTRSSQGDASASTAARRPLPRLDGADPIDEADRRRGERARDRCRPHDDPAVRPHRRRRGRQAERPLREDGPRARAGVVVVPPQRCGFGAASDLMLSGRTVLGHEAVALGLADECVADDAVVDVAIERARSYAENPTPQLRWIKQLITQNANEIDTRPCSARDRGAAAGVRDTRAQGSRRGVPGEAQARLPVTRRRGGVAERRNVGDPSHRLSQADWKARAVRRLR